MASTATPSEVIALDAGGAGSTSCLVGESWGTIEVRRYTFTTPSTGCTQFAVYSWSCITTNMGSDVAWYVDRDPTSHIGAYGGNMKEYTGTIEAYGNDGNTGYWVIGQHMGWGTQPGYVSLNLLPNTTYYLWLFYTGYSGGMEGDSLYAGTTIYFDGSYGPSSLSVSDGSFGREIPISMNKAVTGATHTLTVECGGIRKTLLTDSGDSSVTWTPAVSEYGPAITDAGSAQAVLSLQTYINGSSAGDAVTKTITVSFNRADVKPSTIMTVTDAKGYKDIYGKYVASQSAFLVSLDNTLQYGATVASVTIRACGNVYTTNPATTAAVSTAAPLVTATVTDSRGFVSDEVTYTAEIYAYNAPTETIKALYHADEDGTENEAGLYLAAEIEGSFASLEDQNSVVITAYVKTAAAADYTAAGTVENKTVTVLNHEGTAFIYSPDVTYDLMFVITDEFGASSTVSQRLASRKWAMKFRPGGNGVAFGKAAEYDNVLELPEGWRIKIGEQYWPE